MRLHGSLFVARFKGGRARARSLAIISYILRECYGLGHAKTARRTRASILRREREDGAWGCSRNSTTITFFARGIFMSPLPPCALSSESPPSLRSPAIPGQRTGYSCLNRMYGGGFKVIHQYKYRYINE